MDRSDASTAWSVRPAFARRVGDAVAAIVFLYYLWTNYLAWQETGHAVFFPVVLRNLFLVVLFLIRRPSRATSDRALEWAVALYVTFNGHLYATREAHPLFDDAASAAYALLIMLFSLVNTGIYLRALRVRDEQLG